MPDKIRGFTLLEILVVVVIVGILASLAIPQYQKSVEKAKGSEAIANLNILRGAELRYWGEYNHETINIYDLDVENPNDNLEYFGTYSITIGDIYDGNFTIETSRDGGLLYSGATLKMNQDGDYDPSSTWPFLP